MRLDQIEYGSLLAYSPYGKSEDAWLSQTVTNQIKNDAVLPSQMSMSESIANQISRNLDTLPFADLFQMNPVLVPTPRSSLTMPGSLWVPQRLADALVNRGLGMATVPCLSRVIPVTKSAGSEHADRPTAEIHRDSMGVTTMVNPPSEILLIDDVVTRGATVLGAANKLAEAFPDARIRAFIAMCTRTRARDFVRINDPRKGEIYHTVNGTFREQ